MSNRTFTSRKRTVTGTVTRTITDGRMNAVSYDDANNEHPVHFLDVNVHEATEVRIDQVFGTTLAFVFTTAEGDRTYVTTYGLTLDALAVAVEAAQRSEADKLADA